MKQLKDVMSPQVECIHPAAHLQEAAMKMKDLDCGAIPVCDNDRLVGMVTDRDIVVKGIANGADMSQMCVRDVMTSPISYCFEDQSVEEAARMMETKQIRRVVILNRSKRLVGIVSLGDVSMNIRDKELTHDTLEGVSQPSKKAA